jgi:hypothetical protein
MEEKDLCEGEWLHCVKALNQWALLSDYFKNQSNYFSSEQSSVVSSSSSSSSSLMFHPERSDPLQNISLLAEIGVHLNDFSQKQIIQTELERNKNLSPKDLFHLYSYLYFSLLENKSSSSSPLPSLASEHTKTLQRHYESNMFSSLFLLWHSLPKKVYFPEHSHLLHLTNKLLELHEALMHLRNGTVLLESSSGKKMEATKSYTQNIRNTFNWWNSHLPDRSASISIWVDVTSWRIFFAEYINRLLKQLMEETQKNYIGFHETAHCITSLSKAFLKKGMPEMCLATLQKIYSLPVIDITEAYNKMALIIKSSEWRGLYEQGIENINSSSFHYLQPAQISKIFTYRAKFYDKLGQDECAHREYGSATFTPHRCTIAEKCENFTFHVCTMCGKYVCLACAEKHKKAFPDHEIRQIVENQPTIHSEALRSWGSFCERQWRKRVEKESREGKGREGTFMEVEKSEKVDSVTPHSVTPLMAQTPSSFDGQPQPLVMKSVPSTPTTATTGLGDFNSPSSVWLRNAIGLYLQHINNSSHQKHPTKVFTRLLYLLATHTENIDFFKDALLDAPVWIWLPYVPHLISSLERPEYAQVAPQILSNIAICYPQAIYFPLNAYVSSLRNVDYLNHSPSSPPSTNSPNPLASLATPGLKLATELISKMTETYSGNAAMTKMSLLVKSVERLSFQSTKEKAQLLLAKLLRKVTCTAAQSNGLHFVVMELYRIRDLVLTGKVRKLQGVAPLAQSDDVPMSGGSAVSPQRITFVAAFEKTFGLLPSGSGSGSGSGNNRNPPELKLTTEEVIDRLLFWMDLLENDEKVTTSSEGTKYPKFPKTDADVANYIPLSSESITTLTANACEGALLELPQQYNSLSEPMLQNNEYVRHILIQKERKAQPVLNPFTGQIEEENGGHPGSVLRVDELCRSAASLGVDEKFARAFAFVTTDDCVYWHRIVPVKGGSDSLIRSLNLQQLISGTLMKETHLCARRIEYTPPALTVISDSVALLQVPEQTKSLWNIHTDRVKLLSKKKGKGRMDNRERYKSFLTYYQQSQSSDSGVLSPIGYLRVCESSPQNILLTYFNDNSDSLVEAFSRRRELLMRLANFAAVGVRIFPHTSLPTPSKLLVSASGVPIHLNKCYVGIDDFLHKKNTPVQLRLGPSVLTCGCIESCKTVFTATLAALAGRISPLRAILSLHLLDEAGEIKPSHETVMKVEQQVDSMISSIEMYEEDSKKHGGSRFFFQKSPSLPHEGSAPVRAARVLIARETASALIAEASSMITMIKIDPKWAMWI